MTGASQDTSVGARRPSPARRTAWIALLLLLTCVLAAPSVSLADEPAQETGVQAPSSETATGQEAPAAGEAGQEGGMTEEAALPQQPEAPATGQTEATSTPEAPPAETPPVVEAPPVETQPVVETAPVVETQPVVETPPVVETQPVVETPPPAVETPAPAETPAPSEPVKTEKSQERTGAPVELTKEKPAEAPNPPVQAPAVTTAAAAPTIEPGTVAPPPVETLQGVVAEEAAAAGVLRKMRATRRPVSLGCELSALEGSVSNACREASAPIAVLGTSTMGLAMDTYGSRPSGETAGAGQAGDTSPSSDDNGRPASPSPGPAPSGAAGGSGSAGAAGSMAGPLTRGAWLRLTSPRAVRRLKLAHLPWRTAFFVLIPERPG
jgi:hypothetical protein